MYDLVADMSRRLRAVLLSLPVDGMKVVALTFLLPTHDQVG